MPHSCSCTRACVLALASCCGLAACGPDDYTRLYKRSDRAPSFEEADIRALRHLGPSLADRGVNFGLYSQNATKIELLLFDGAEEGRPSRTFDLTRFDNVWNVHVEGVGVGQVYGFRVFGPNWPFDPAWTPGTSKGFVADVDALGNRFNPNKLLFDPYGKAISRDHDWSKGSSASGPWGAENDYAAAMKSVVVRSGYSWSANEQTWRERRQAADFPGHGWNEQVVYEVHVKGFTKDAHSGVQHPGTYRGFGEKADYFKDLGVSAVELLPVFEKPLDGGYWGYNTLSFFVPEISYAYGHDVANAGAATRRPEEPMDDFKWMVDELHKRGVEVWLDVVYNHYGEGGLWRQMLEVSDSMPVPGLEGTLANYDPKEIAGLYAYRGIDNAAYYALAPDRTGVPNQMYWNNTGVGTQSRPNNDPVRRLIIDSLEYWVEEMHVDGFRFDLAPVLGEIDGDYDHWDNVAQTVLQQIIDDPLLQKYSTRIVAEPWSAGGKYSVQQTVGGFPKATEKDGTGWGEWNPVFRDWWRSFVNDDGYTLNRKEWWDRVDGGGTMTGSSALYPGKRPYHSMNFITVHDGFTMYDLLSYWTKQNGCSPINPICCISSGGSPDSPWCVKQAGESNNRSRDWGSDEAGESTKRQLMRDFFAAMLFSHGTPMLLGGDEWLRTQLGNNNAFGTTNDNAENWYKWNLYLANDDTARARQRMHDFVRKLVKFRRTHGYAFAPSTYEEGAASFAWKNPSGGPMQGGDWSGRRVMLHWSDPARGPQLVVMVNMDRTDADFAMPAGATWRRVVDTQGYFDQPGIVGAEGRDPSLSMNAEIDKPVELTGTKYGVKGSSIVILEEKR